MTNKHDHKAFQVHPTIPFRLLSKNEVAKMLGYTPRTIDRLVTAGKIPYVRLPLFSGRGTKIRFDSRDIEKWLNAIKEQTREKDERIQEYYAKTKKR